MNEKMSRRVVHGDSLTVARIELASGAVVPRHAHTNEQLATVERGSVRFIFDDKDMLLNAGESMLIAASEPHEVHALEDSTIFDVFAPRRDDWISGDDLYLRDR